MKKISLFVVVAVVSYGIYQQNPALLSSLVSNNSYSQNSIQDAFENRKSDVQVEGEGEVIRLLADDNDGSRHQKFLVRLSTSQTLLIAHNIDLAPRINTLPEGDNIKFYGEYEWNSKGGVIHWTHHDPNGSHVGGWIKHQGRIYQ